MIHHLVLFKLNKDVTDKMVDLMISETHNQLAKIPSVLNVNCGKNIEDSNGWKFFLSVDLESVEHLKIYASHPLHLKFVEEVIRPHTSDRLALDYEIRK